MVGEGEGQGDRSCREPAGSRAAGGWLDVNNRDLALALLAPSHCSSWCRPPQSFRWWIPVLSARDLHKLVHVAPRYLDQKGSNRACPYCQPLWLQVDAAWSFTFLSVPCNILSLDSHGPDIDGEIQSNWSYRQRGVLDAMKTMLHMYVVIRFGLKAFFLSSLDMSCVLSIWWFAAAASASRGGNTGWLKFWWFFSITICYFQGENLSCSSECPCWRHFYELALSPGWIPNIIGRAMTTR
jgi:hypothetical protein